MVVVSAHASPRERKPALLFGDRRERIKQIARRAGQPVETHDDQNIAFLELSDRPAQLQPIGSGTARHLAEYSSGAGGAQPADLGLDALAVG